jgi:hypothetical protein
MNRNQNAILRKKNANLYFCGEGLAVWVRAAGATAPLRFLALFIRKMEFWQGPASGIVISIVIPISRNCEFVTSRYFQIG